MQCLGSHSAQCFAGSSRQNQGKASITAAWYSFRNSSFSLALPKKNMVTISGVNRHRIDTIRYQSGSGFIMMPIRVRHHIDTNSDPDPTFHFDVDPDPASYCYQSGSGSNLPFRSGSYSQVNTCWKFEKKIEYNTQQWQYIDIFRKILVKLSILLKWL
jgi:hypothetical protein